MKKKRCSDCNVIIYIYMSVHTRKDENLLFLSLSIHRLTDILYMYIRRHGVSKPSGTESFTSSVHTNGTKTKPTNPPTSQQMSTASSLLESIWDMLIKTFTYEFSAHCSFSSHRRPFIVKASLQKAFERLSRASCNPTPRTCAERDFNLPFISHSFTVGQGGKTWP